MNLVVIPFHDWRKSEKEGFRTRDVHFIRAFHELDGIEKILVINRPSTPIELWAKKFSKDLRGEVVLEKGKFRLTKIDEGLYVADCFSKDMLGQAIHRQAWFLDAFGHEDYCRFVQKACELLDMKGAPLLTQNVFSFKMVSRLEAPFKLFDAWDNFLKFPAYQKFKGRLWEGYQSLSETADAWITNSHENISFFRKNFNPRRIELVKNGVRRDFGGDTFSEPEDLGQIARPIFGFGGKISYLLDYELINFITKAIPDASFVFVGQILDKEVFKKIIRRPNVHFLGDKPYAEYANYVKGFDTCLVPYRIKEGQHGGDSMKVYEYLLLGKKVVGTNGNGLEDLQDYIYVAHTPQEFALALADTTNARLPFPIEEHTWKAKAEKLVEKFKEF
ncbi:glycosyltransferase [Robiginitalea marina]|uniref:Glycosyltransferase n=1 Tax=Robiginitalea marina TaxID=2954105 RepID=A0ABT1AW43_9FLAO|nr:glycosyltransferase [Robiginitalea marina]MCO5724232.1 glycosyltransferase [Robiginitalea marina]